MDHDNQYLFSWLAAVIGLKTGGSVDEAFKGGAELPLYPSTDTFTLSTDAESSK